MQVMDIQFNGCIKVFKTARLARANISHFNIAVIEKYYHLDCTTSISL